MLLFFFMLLMLAMAWGVADHFQSMISNAPPPKPAPAALEAAHRQPPAAVPAAGAPAPDGHAADDAGAATHAAAGQPNPDHKTGKTP